MPLEEKDKILIEQYLQGSLDAEGEQVWASRKSDLDVQKELAVQQDLRMAFRAEGREQLKTRFQQLEIERTELGAKGKELVPKLPWAGLLTIAASILLLLGALWWLNGSEPLSSHAAFTQYYEAYPNLVAPVTKGGEPVEGGDRAFQLYEIGEYERALSIFEALPQEEAKMFYQGLTYIALNRPQQAAPLLSLISTNKTSSYRQTAQWYFALTTLQMDKMEACRHKLKQILEDAEHPYFEVAKKLLNDLPNK